jgi:hypothetical protein
MRKGDLVKRIKKAEASFYDEMKIDDTGVIVRGPYEKNISDILYHERPWSKSTLYKMTEIKRVIDVLNENRVYKFCLVEEYERVRP